MSLPSKPAAGPIAKPDAALPVNSATTDAHPVKRRRLLAFQGDHSTASTPWQLAQDTLTKLLITAACVLSAWHLGAFLVIVRGRLFYPYALEWMEGGMLEHVARIMEGKPLYLAPSIEFTPFIYTPLYYWVSAAVAHFLGVQLASLRLVSCLASASIFVLLFSIIYSRTRNLIAGFIAAGLYASCFDVCAGWFDLARVDSLSLCFLLLATWLVVRSDRRDAWAGLFLALAFLAKQSGVIVAVPLIAARIITQSGWRRVHAALTFSIVVLTSTILQDHFSHGYYHYYVFDLPSQHAWIAAMRREFWRSDMFANVPFACAAALCALTISLGWRNQVLLWAAAIGYCAVGWISRMHVGGASNVLMPTMAFLAWATAETLHRLSQLSVGDLAPVAPATLWARSLRYSSSLFGLALCVAQLSWLVYRPGAHIPSAKNRKGGDALIAYLRTLPGPILSPLDPLLPRLIGQTGSAHEQALTDISLGIESKKTAAVTRSIHEVIARRRYAVVVGGWQTAELSTANYVPAPLTQVPSSWTLEGAPFRTSEIWLRNAPDATKH